MSRLINSIEKLLLPSILFLIGCQQSAPDPVRPCGGLSLQASVSGESIRTKADIAYDELLQEADLSGGLDMYVSGNGVFKRYIVPSVENGKVSFVTSKWREDGIVPGLSYDVYVVAGAGGHAAGSLEGLAAARQTDTDIYRLYDPDAGTFDLAKTSSKLFLMDGHSTWIPQDAAEQTVSVELERAAAKIQLDFTLADTLANYKIYGTPQWKFVNYASSVSLLPEATPSSPDLTRTPSLMNVTSYTESEGHITTYSFPHKWSDVDSTMRIILNVPLQDSLGNVINANYYSIPIRDVEQSAPFSIERNHYYHIQVDLECVGSSAENSSEMKLGLEYAILPWVYNAVLDDVTIIDQEVEYLMISPEDAEIREKVLSGSLSPRQLQISFWSSSAITVSTPETWYYDKDGVLRDASSAFTSVSVSGNTAGSVDVTSTALTNNTIKYIKFRVSLANNPGIYKEVTIRHYPLDYILNMEGKWSSRITSGWVNWDTDQASHTPRKTVQADIFTAKVMGSDGYAHYITEQRYGSYYRAVQGNAVTNLRNNHMYVVQITSTSDSYTIGRVTLDSNFQSQEHLVSPAFMIASQLGATQTTTSATAAASDCGLYKEVSTDGISYEGWRLPTREEVGIIMTYQYSSDAIAEVLAGSHYWTLEGKAVSKDNHTNVSADATTGFVRCVRDLTPEDIEYLKNKE